MSQLTIRQLQETLAATGVDLTAPPAQHVMGRVPLQDGHSIEILAPVPVFFSAAEARAYGHPCYVVGELTPGRWTFTYTTGEADIGFAGTESDIARRVVEYLHRNWRGIGPALDQWITTWKEAQ